MSPLRRLLSIRSEVGRPGTVLNIGDSAGSRLYVEAVMGAVSIVAALEPADVAELHAVTAEWLRERADVTAGPPFTPPAGSPLVGGLLGRLITDAGRSRTVQSRTVHSPDQQEHREREFPLGV